jgi:hypothetical protein
VITFQCDMCGIEALTVRLASTPDEFGRFHRLEDGWERIAACLPEGWLADGFHVICDNDNCLLKLKRHQQYRPQSQKAITA